MFSTPLDLTPTGGLLLPLNIYPPSLLLHSSLAVFSSPQSRLTSPDYITQSPLIFGYQLVSAKQEVSLKTASSLNNSSRTFFSGMFYWLCSKTASSTKLLAESLTSGYHSGRIPSGLEAIWLPNALCTWGWYTHPFVVVPLILHTPLKTVPLLSFSFNVSPVFCQGVQVVLSPRPTGGDICPLMYLACLNKLYDCNSRMT